MSLIINSSSTSREGPVGSTVVKVTVGNGVASAETLCAGRLSAGNKGLGGLRRRGRGGLIGCARTSS
ncbi:hypothetical protein SNK04_005893 [Fusarium graminearum]